MEGARPPLALLGLPAGSPAPQSSPDSCCHFSSCQQLLPATGVPVTRRQFDHMRGDDVVMMRGMVMVVMKT